MLHFRLYAITDRHRCAPTPLIHVVSELLDAGVPAIQLREKDLDDTALRRLAEPIAEMCQTYRAALFINTNARIARDVGAAGVHLPAHTGSVESVRAEVGENLAIGCSVHTLAAAKKRETEGADLLTYSPIYPTANKGPAVGTAGLSALVAAVAPPVFALGGITPARVPACLAAGAFGVAVMSGLMSAAGARDAAKTYLDVLP